MNLTDPRMHRESHNRFGGRLSPIKVDTSQAHMMRLNLALLKPASPRKRLWQGGIALLLVIVTLLAGNMMLPADRSVDSAMVGHDFLAFYTAGTFARLGQEQQLYDLSAVRSAQHALANEHGLDLSGRFAPWWNPPFYAWLFAPLSAMPYPAARALWSGINIACLLAAIALLARMLPALVARPPAWSHLPHDPIPLEFRRDWRNWALVPLLVGISFPCIQFLTHGQNTGMSLLLLTLVVIAWRKRLPVLAGVLCGLLLYKPQLAVVVGAMLVLSLGLRVCLGLSCVAGSLLLIGGWTLPGTLGNYIDQLPANLTAMQVNQSYIWERHATLLALWRLLFQGRAAGEIGLPAHLLTVLSCGALGAGLLFAWFRSRSPGIDDCWTGETRTLARDRVIGATITSMPLLMPFYFDYDLLLLSIPATLFAGELLSRPVGAPLDRAQRLLLGGWIALYACTLINPAFARATGVNLTVLALCFVSGVSIFRAAARGVRTSSIILPQIQRVVARRAA